VIGKKEGNLLTENLDNLSYGPTVPIEPRCKKEETRLRLRVKTRKGKRWCTDPKCEAGIKRNISTPNRTDSTVGVRTSYWSAAKEEEKTEANAGSEYARDLKNSSACQQRKEQEEEKPPRPRRRGKLFNLKSSRNQGEKSQDRGSRKPIEKKKDGSGEKT